MNRKHGVESDKLHPSFKKVETVVDGLWPLIYPEDLDGPTMTSGHEGQPGDGVHSPLSKHYIQNNPDNLGHAIDLRIRDTIKFRAHWFAFIFEMILANVAHIQVRIYIENLLGSSAHIHVELE